MNPKENTDNLKCQESQKPLESKKGIISKTINSLCALSVAATMHIVDPKNANADVQWDIQSSPKTWLQVWEGLTSKEIFIQLQQIWVSPEMLEGSKKIDISESDEVEQTPLSKEDAFWIWEFTAENISNRLEKIAKKFNSLYGSQYVYWDWTESMQKVAPLEEEAIMLNNYLERLPNKIEKPLDTWQTMVSLLALDRQKQLDKTPLMDFLLLDDAYKVLKVIRPDLAEKWTVIELWPEFGWKTYTIVQPTAENMFAVNSFLYHKIPAEKIIDFEEAYAKIVEEGKNEYRKNAISEYVNEYWYTLEEATLEVEEEIETTLLPIFDWLKERTWEVSKPWSNTLINYTPDTVSKYFSWLPWDYYVVYSWLKWEKIIEAIKSWKEALQKLWQSV